MTTFAPGDRVVWLQTPRGGYGYTLPIHARILRTGAKIKVAVYRSEDQTIAHRSVSPDNIRTRTEPFPPLDDLPLEALYDRVRP